MSVATASQPTLRCLLSAEQGANRGNGPRRQAGQRKLRKHQRVLESMRQRLANGTWAAGARVPPLRTLAREFNVSTVTVRQSLRMLEKEGHVQCFAGVGIFLSVPVPARQVTGQTTIAFATIEIESALTTQVTQGIEEACLQRAWSMQLLSAHGDTELEARNLSHLAEAGLKGAIILPGDSTENLEAIVRLKLNGCPIVLAGRALPGLKVDVVESDHEKGAYLATEHLLKNGHRRVLVVAPKPALISPAHRLRGYEQALIDHGLEPLRAWKVWIDDALENKGRRQGNRWLGGCTAILPVLKKSEPPIAVLAHDAHSGWGVFEACRELGLSIPDEVSVVCLEDAEFTRALAPPMTAIREHADEIARGAVQLLERRLSDSSLFEPEHILLAVELIERGSVAPTRGMMRSGRRPKHRNR